MRSPWKATAAALAAAGLAAGPAGAGPPPGGRGGGFPPGGRGGQPGFGGGRVTTGQFNGQTYQQFTPGGGGARNNPSGGFGFSQGGGAARSNPFGSANGNPFGSYGGAGPGMTSVNGGTLGGFGNRIFPGASGPAGGGGAGFNPYASANGPPRSYGAAPGMASANGGTLGGPGGQLFPGASGPAGGGGGSFNPYAGGFGPPAGGGGNPFPAAQVGVVNTYPAPAYNNSAPVGVPQDQPAGYPPPQVAYAPGFPPAPAVPAGGGAAGNPYSPTPAYQPPAAPAGGGAAGNPYAVAARVALPPAEQWFRNRYILLRNQSGQPLTFHVRYHNRKAPADGWLPAAGGYLAGVRLEPGEETYLSANGYRVTADKLRFYVTTDDGRKLTRYLSRDLFPGDPHERDANGDLAYRAAGVNTYTYTVNRSKKS